MSSLQDVAATIGRDQLAAHEYRKPAVLAAALREHTIQELAEAFHVAPSTIARWKAKHDIETSRDCDHGEAVRKGIERSRERRQQLLAAGEP